MSTDAIEAAPSTAVPATGRRVLRFVGRQLRWSWPFLLLVLLFAVYDGWQRRSAGGDAGNGLRGAIRSPVDVDSARRFRVGLYNIQGAVNKTDDVLARIGKAMASTDIAGLVEVRANARKLDGRNQAQKLGEMLGRGWIFAPAERRFWADGGGNGMVSRIPVGPWTRLPLPAAGDRGSHRNVLLVDLPVAGRTVHLLVAHVDRGDARAGQLQAVTHLFRSVAGPAVLLGDLNTRPNDAAIRPLLEDGGVDAIARAGATGSERVDWIIARGLNVIDAGIADDPSLSDHSFYWADLELAP